MWVTRWVRLGAACKRAVCAARGGERSSFLGPRRAWIAPTRLCRSYLGDLCRDESVWRYVERLIEEYRSTGEKLRQARLSEPERRELNKKHVELQSVAQVYQRVEDAQAELQELASLKLGSAGSKDEDEQMVQLLKEEEAELLERILDLKKELIKALVPVDPLDSSNVVLEVVSGRTTGGDICQQFTAEMFHMYKGFASYKQWDFEVLNYTPADHGLHHAAVTISGPEVYRYLKHEGGTHRVQRIPEVGLSSRMQRIHTGTMTVIILPQPVELDVSIDPKDLRIDTFKSRGAGGQSVNTTDSAVRIVHLPTGMVAECQQSRSQLKNRDTAMQLLRARLYQSRMGKETEKRDLARKRQWGTRSQAERIRTYTFSQDRVTDHRTGFTARDIKTFMRGGEALDDLICHVLEHADQEALLELVESSLATTGENGKSAD